MVARRDVIDPVADRLDNPRALVTEDHRPASVAELAVGEPHVGVTHAGCGDADEHLVRLRRIELHVLDRDGALWMTQDDRSHPTRHCSSVSKSGSTPSPGPTGGAIVPSAAISTGCGSSQSRRSAVRPGGS